MPSAGSSKRKWLTVAATTAVAAATTFVMSSTLAGPAVIPFGLSKTAIADLYERLAFGSELETPGTERFREHIKKRDPKRVVRVVVLPQPSTPIDQTVASAKAVIDEITDRSAAMDTHVLSMDELSEILSATPERRSDLADALFVFIGNREELMAGIGKVVAANGAVAGLSAWASSLRGDEPMCFVMATSRDGTASIGYSMAWIEAGAALEECLYEEVMQSFGIANDFPAGVPSLFSDDRVYRVPSELDWVLWRIHTDPRIVAGMSKMEARAVVSVILDGIAGSAAPR